MYQPFVIEKNGDYSVKMLSFNDAQITIAFDGFEPNMKIIQRCLEENADLIEQRC